MRKISILFSAIAVFSFGIYADAQSIAKAEIGVQFELLKKGDVNALRSHFTDRQKGRVTAQKVKQGHGELSKYSLDDLVAKVIEGSYKGNKTMKIKMKNGRTLTTLVEEGGKWRADTIWFR
jgi:hypothetical protein